MLTNHSLEILFLTNFSDSCYRAIPALAQMVDEIDARITIMHVLTTGADPAAENKLASFFPEADSYHSSRRFVAHGSLLESVKKVCREQRVDLIVAPSSDPLGMPRFWSDSIRARLISECGIPVWTSGQRSQPVSSSRATKNVGCWVDLDSSHTSHIGLAFEYASKLGARLHLLHSLPEIDEGSLLLPLSSDAPLNEENAREAIQSLLGWVPIRPDVHVGHGRVDRVLPQIARELQLDAVFLGQEQSLRSGWLGSRLSSAIDGCHCPVICSRTDTTRTTWNLSRGPAFAAKQLAVKVA